MDLPLSLVSKPGSIAVHADELLSPKGHEFDRAALQTLLRDPEVNAFLLDNKCLFPVKR